MRSQAWLGIFALAALVAAGCTAPAAGPTDLDAVLVAGDHATAPPDVDGARLAADLESFVTGHADRRNNLPDHLAARDVLASMFGDAGLEVWRQPFHDGIDQENIIGIKWGTLRDRWFIVGGHYDTFTNNCIPRDDGCDSKGISQGAYDNGAGTMITAHLATTWADTPTAHTIAFVAFDGEERGLQGAKALAAALQTGAHPYGAVEVTGMLNLDMLGLNWPGTGAPIHFLGDPPMWERVQRAATAAGHPPEHITDDVLLEGSSDHVPFGRAGIQNGMLWSSFDSLGAPAGIPVATPAGVYPHWHMVDRYETMLSMAGTPEHLAAGLHAAADLVGHVLFLATVEEPLAAVDVAAATG